ELETPEPPERLDDVFLFVEDDSRITIERLGPDGRSETIPEPGPAASAPAPAEPEPLVPPPPAATLPSRPSSAAPTPARSAPAPSTNGSGAAARRGAPRIRVDATQLDDLVGYAGELAVLSDNLQGLRDLPGAERWVVTLEALDRVSRLI